MASSLYQKTYHQATGWQPETTFNNPLIGYQDKDGNWVNDLWIKKSYEEPYNADYVKLDSIDISLNFNKLFLNDINTQPFELNIDFYSQLPHYIVNNYKNYTVHVTPEHHYLGSCKQRIDARTVMPLKISSKHNIYVPKNGNIYLHIYSTSVGLNNDIIDNNEVKAYLQSDMNLNLQSNISYQKIERDYTVYYPNSKYICAQKHDIIYQQSRRPSPPNVNHLLSAEFGYQFKYEPQLLPESYKVYQVPDKYTGISMGLHDNNNAITVSSVVSKTAPFGRLFTLTYQHKHYQLLNWKINGQSYGNQNPFTFTISKQMCDQYNNIRVEIEEEQIEHYIYGPFNNSPKTVISGTKLKAQSLNESFIEKLPFPLSIVGWKDINTNQEWRGEEEIEVSQDLYLKPILSHNNKIPFIFNPPDINIATLYSYDDKALQDNQEKYLLAEVEKIQPDATLDYNPLGYYTLAPLAGSDTSIYAFQQDCGNGEVKIYSIYEIMDIETFNSYFQLEDNLATPIYLKPIRREINSNFTQAPIIYYKSQKGVWERVE